MDVEMLEAGCRDEVLTVSEAAKFLRVTTVFIYKLTAKNEIPCHRLGAKILLIKSELLEYLKKL